MSQILFSDLVKIKLFKSGSIENRIFFCFHHQNFPVQIFRIFAEYFSVFPKILPEYFYRKEFPENWEFQQKTENFSGFGFYRIKPWSLKLLSLSRNLCLSTLTLERDSNPSLLNNRLCFVKNLDIWIADHSVSRGALTIWLLDKSIIQIPTVLNLAFNDFFWYQIRVLLIWSWSIRLNLKNPIIKKTDDRIIDQMTE